MLSQLRRIRRWQWVSGFGALVVAGVVAGSCGRPLDDDDEDLIVTRDGLSCGVERWAVKTGSDPDVAAVNLTPVDTTVSTLAAIAAPAILPDMRLAPVELTTYRLRDVTLTGYRLEPDGDLHLIVSDGSQTLIVEIPAPDCVDASSPFLASIQGTREAFLATHAVTTSLTSTREIVTVVGVGFFDFLHGQTGVAPNGLELHAVLSLCSGVGCSSASAGGFRLSVSTADVRLSQGGTASIVLSSTSNGLPQSIELSLSAPPDGVSATLGPATIVSGLSSTVTFEATSSAPSQSATVVVTGVGPTMQQTVKLSLTVGLGSGGPVNGGFESGLTGWSVTGDAQIVAEPHAGLLALELNGATLPGSATATQSFEVPAGAGWLVVWYRGLCEAGSGSISVELTDANGLPLAWLLPASCASATWTQLTTDVSALAGRQVKLVLSAEQDPEGHGVYALFDDVSFWPAPPR